MVKEIRDALDFISLAVAVFAGFVSTDLVEKMISEYLLEERGKVALGGEIFLYAIVLGGVTFIVFQLVTKTFHELVDHD